MDVLHFFRQGRFIAAGARLIGLAAGGMALGPRFFWPQGGMPSPQDRPRQPPEEPRFVEARRRMVEQQLRNRDITDTKVLEVMGRIARQFFVPEDIDQFAYDDCALPIEENQTISQPYIVAVMTQLARLTPQSRVLEIGSGSGYQAAVLAELSKEVYSIEILKPLADRARERLAALGYRNVTIRHGDGYQGWAEHAPYDVILVTAAPDHVPKSFEEQLAVGGRMVIPLGRGYQELMLLEKRQDGTIRREPVIGVKFVLMTGETEHRTQ